MNIHAFGDSFTNAFENQTIPYVQKYIKWKGYKPKSYLDNLSEYYNCDSFNHAIQGADNYTILQSFCDNLYKIKKDDLVIINWSNINRFRVVNKENNWIRILPTDLKILNQTEISDKTANEILINRMSEKYVEEVKSWSKMIDKLSINKKIFQWTYLDELSTNIINKVNLIYEKISFETNGLIDDFHLSEKGNEELSEDLIKILDRKLI
jgi:hypothetical protein